MLTPNAFAVLRYLLEHAGRLVTEQELLEAVWPKTFVEPQAVKRQIYEVRKTLGDDARTPRYIETLQRHGYRFIAPVQGESMADPAVVPKRHNLPEQLTSFIGRDKEIAEIKELLLTGTRLLVLTGAGGCGKTRLALQVATELLDNYPDGVWLVELAALAEPGFVPEAVATVFGLNERPGTHLRDTIAEHLARKRALVVLDNAEHLLAACAALADVVLRQCAQLTIMVTSRQRLGMSGEHTYRVPSLSFPASDQKPTPEQISAYESARLFIERARLLRPHFSITAENAPALASICQRLDGIPLAIELAAARVRSMSVEEVSQGLDQRFGLLTGGSRTALPRQQTLRSLIDWSYDSLGDVEKALLRRVSVFSGGWTLEAAEQVCIGAGVDGVDVLDLLTSLADKNLLLAEQHNGATRYGLLETVRQYALDLRREHGDEALWQHRHLAYFLALAEMADAHLNSSEQQAWLDRLELEHDNLRAALGCACSAGGDAVSGLRMAGALYRFWSTRGYANVGRSWCAKALAAASSSHAPAARAKALRSAGGLAHRQGDYPAAEELLCESLAINRTLHNQPGIGSALNGLGIVARLRGDLAAARAMFEEGLAIHRELGDQRGVQNSLTSLGILASERDDHCAARILYEESLAISRELGTREIAVWTLNNLGVLAYAAGDYAAARAWHEESLAVGRELGSPLNIATSLNNQGMVASAEGDHVAARALCREGLVIRRELGDRWGIAWSLEAIAVAHSLTAPLLAACIWGCAQRLREEIGSPLPPPWCPRYEHQIATARKALGDDAAFDRAWQEGRAMTLDKAIEYALEKR